LLSTIIAPGDVVFSDQLNHASIIDGLRLSKAEKIVFPHNDLAQLETRMQQLAASRRPGQAWFVITESLFGMEGDASPLLGLANLVERHDAQLIVDEAHATGCFGSQGSGLVDAVGVRSRVLATIHTGGKALGVPGAYVVGSTLLKEILVNRCRHMIFTTALPPQIGQWWLDMLAIAPADEPTRTRLQANAAFFRKECDSRGVSLGGQHYIATMTLGVDTAAVGAAQRLQQAGFDVRAIRPPTVPAGTARLRISIHADHDSATLSNLATALASL
jgi:7-keto-8-aminopelargonate synthetase-like enzyme